MIRLPRLVLSLCLLLATICAAQSPTDGGLWRDTDGNILNAHGGNVLRYKGTYYWYGEARAAAGSTYSSLGVSLYTSRDMRRWKCRGLVLAANDVPSSVLEKGCIIERPKVIRNAHTGQFVLWFHLELKGQGYAAARYAVATSPSPLGPFRYVRSGRVNPGVLPINLSAADTADLRHRLRLPELQKWWTPEWRRQVERGMFCLRDVAGGQMARDMALFVDDDGTAYHIYASEDNLTLQIARLTPDYLAHDGLFVRIAPGGLNEAPVVFKKDGVYWMITSGCTGWAPNAARLFRADSILGPWRQLPNPCRGRGADITFGAQGSSVFTVQTACERNHFGGAGYVFMADIWNPRALNTSRYLWIPLSFEDDAPVLRR